jgi:O-methyltransferase
VLNALNGPGGGVPQRPEWPARPQAKDAAGLYLDLLELCLCNLIYRDGSRTMGVERDFNSELRDNGMDWPLAAHTMIGRVRLSHLRRSVEHVLEEGIPGDLIETGVWRGGACILMRGVLAAHGVTDRIVHVADSFCGLPPPDPTRYPADTNFTLHEHPELAIPRAEVEEAFRRYELLDHQVRFHEGWFKDTLPRLGGERFALIRLDGDMYESTWTALTELYPRLSPGGFAVIDDYGCFEACRSAVEDYRGRYGVVAPIEPIDWGGAFWRKPV